jgi:hypothetical protein
MGGKQEARQAGGLLLAGTGGALILMLHHPTSLKGPDDGLLLGDWSNAGVHGGMVACLLAICVGGSSLPRWLGDANLSVRAGRVAFTGGMAALIAAGLINGFATGSLEARAGSVSALSIQFGTLAALNQTFAVFGVAMVAAAMGLWSARMLRLDPIAKIAGGAGLAAAALAAGWLAVGGGAFGLVPAVVATLVFGAWSALTAAALLRGPSGWDE